MESADDRRNDLNERAIHKKKCQPLCLQRPYRRDLLAGWFNSGDIYLCRVVAPVVASVEICNIESVPEDAKLEAKLEPCCGDLQTAGIEAEMVPKAK
jgi:hypothetical protein